MKTFTQIMVETKLPATLIVAVMADLGLKGRKVNGSRVWNSEEIKQIVELAIDTINGVRYA